MDEQVSITCYNQTDVMTRKEGLDLYLECMMCSEGCEQERYTNIYLQLMDGLKECNDSIPTYGMC